MRPQLRIRNTFSRDYEGIPVSGAVKVPVRNTDVKIVDYDVKSGVALSQSATTYKNIPVDNHKAINELIDGYESQAVPDNFSSSKIRKWCLCNSFYSRSRCNKSFNNWNNRFNNG